MEIQKYLTRIGFEGKLRPDHKTLRCIHHCHVFNVPFENVDIQFGRPIGLEVNALFEKVVSQNRGGFCYELNFLFHFLLRAIGFSSQIIAARIFEDSGEQGPPFDHMAVLVKTDRPFLVDVGFGNLFVEPLEIITDQVQFDGRHSFKIESYGEADYQLSMLMQDGTYQGKYTFNLEECFIEDFLAICQDKQTNPDSYFVKNLLCTLPIYEGRVTLFNGKLTQTLNGQKQVSFVDNEFELKQVLKEKFSIEI